MRRIYLFGYSAGAVFALYMAPMQSRYFAAAAVHAGAYGGEADLAFLDTAPRKVPLFVSAGAQDRLFPPPVVLATVARLQRAGFPVTRAAVEGMPHSYQASAEINERAWPVQFPPSASTVSGDEQPVVRGVVAIDALTGEAQHVEVRLAQQRDRLPVFARVCRPGRAARAGSSRAPR